MRTESRKARRQKWDESGVGPRTRRQQKSVLTILFKHPSETNTEVFLVTSKYESLHKGRLTGFEGQRGEGQVAAHVASHVLRGEMGISRTPYELKQVVRCEWGLEARIVTCFVGQLYKLPQGLTRDKETVKAYGYPQVLTHKNLALGLRWLLPLAVGVLTGNVSQLPTIYVR